MSPFVEISAENTKKILRGEEFPGDQFRYNPKHPSCIVLIERHAKGEPKVKLFDDPIHATHIYHFGHVWEENPETLEFNACCLPESFNMYDKTEQWLGDMETYKGEEPTRMCGYRLEKGKLTRKTLFQAIAEFPTVHPLRHVGTRLRYTYVMASQKDHLPFYQILKLDRIGPTQIYSAEGFTLGEPLFAPRHGVRSSIEGDEDDGWVITQRRAVDHSTAVVVLDARTMKLQCVINLPLPVPMAFHGSWLPEVLGKATASSL
eukprot:GEMP01018846.1.p1 GENE.GEMP01018846.1~~GEMP01018846.1.p1  ORF type:complete len:261 (+),score=57.69 GEMP01018846.1:1395-2177(+)